jgi:hypothetical protein
MKHPLQTAKQIADLIKGDPISASFVTQFIKPDELVDYLDLHLALGDVIADAIEHAVRDEQHTIASLEERNRELNAEVANLNWQLSPR